MFKVLLQFCWRRGSKDSRGQGFKGLFSKDFISALNILSLSAILKKIDTTDIVTRTLESLTPPAVLAPVAAGVPSGITLAKLEIISLILL